MDQTYLFLLSLPLLVGVRAGLTNRLGRLKPKVSKFIVASIFSFELSFIFNFFLNFKFKRIKNVCNSIIRILVYF